MENYFTFTRLLSLRDSEGANLPLFKDARAKRYQSVERILELLEIAGSTKPSLPSPIITLNPLDRTSLYTQPNGTIKCPSQLSNAADIGPMLEESPPSSYLINDSVLLLLQLQHLQHQHQIQNIQKRVPLPCRFHLRWCICLIPQANPQNKPLWWVLLPQIAGASQAERIPSRPSRYIGMNVDVKKAVWWNEDFKETLAKVHRQANNNSSSDYADSELILQDFINRYVDPSASSPMHSYAGPLWSYINIICQWHLNTFNPIYSNRLLLYHSSLWLY